MKTNGYRVTYTSHRFTIVQIDKKVGTRSHHTLHGKCSIEIKATSILQVTQFLLILSY